MAMEPEGAPLITAKPDPLRVAEETSTAEVPTFVTVTLCTAVLPVATLPKLMLAALTERTPEFGVLGWTAALVKPEQLESPTMAIMAASIAKRTNRPDGGSVTLFLDAGDWIRCGKVCVRTFISRTV